MARLLCLLTLFTGTMVFGVDRDGREDSGMTDDYKLYDRNQAGLDWNRYNYPDAKEPVQY